MMPLNLFHLALVPKPKGVGLIPWMSEYCIAANLLGGFANRASHGGNASISRLAKSSSAVTDPIDQRRVGWPSRLSCSPRCRGWQLWIFALSFAQLGAGERQYCDSKPTLSKFRLHHRGCRLLWLRSRQPAHCVRPPPRAVVGGWRT